MVEENHLYHIKELFVNLNHNYFEIYQRVLFVEFYGVKRAINSPRVNFRWTFKVGAMRAIMKNYFERMFSSNTKMQRYFFSEKYTYISDYIRLSLIDGDMMWG